MNKKNYIQKIKFTILLSLFFTVLVFGQEDWDALVVPAESGNTNYSWQLIDELSDSFNYEAPFGSNKGAEFNSKWEDGYINSWPGFGNTTWTPNNSRVTAGNLELKATSLNAATNTNNFSAIHARIQIIYPVYIETRMKIMNSVMANAVWMLSDNSKEEIDIVEAYGSSFSESQNQAKTWFAERMHLSHHTFSQGGIDYQPTDSGSYYRLKPNGSVWRDGFHRVGMYWRDPFHLEYYIDGNLVRTVSGASIIDPNEHLNGNGLSLPETIIFSGAAQQWQVNNGLWPTTNELLVEANNIFQVDWIRTYKRVDVLSIKENEISKFVNYPNPVSKDEFVSIKPNSGITKINIYNINGALLRSFKHNPANQRKIYINDLSSGMYVLKLLNDAGNWYSASVFNE